MRPLRLYRDDELDPARMASRGRGLLLQARDEGVASLHVHGSRGDVLALGRYHRVPAATTRSSGVARRLSGGRAMPLGDGFVGVSLALPHRSALVADEPAALAPAQVLNRAVRGLLGALESLGVAPHHPGRDVVTVAGRIVAAMAFEVGAHGETLVEMAVATGRSYASVTAFADRADPHGVVAIDFVAPEQATCIADETGRAPDVDAMARALADGYRARLDLASVPATSAPPDAEPDADWVRRATDPPTGGHARRRDMLGVVEAYVARAGDRIASVRLCGDVIAPSATVARIETALQACSPTREAIVAAVRTAAAGPDDFVLGVRLLDTIADLVLEACGP